MYAKYSGQIVGSILSEGVDRVKQWLEFENDTLKEEIHLSMAQILEWNEMLNGPDYVQQADIDEYLTPEIKDWEKTVLHSMGEWMPQYEDESHNLKQFNQSNEMANFEELMWSKAKDCFNKLTPHISWDANSVRFWTQMPRRGWPEHNPFKELDERTPQNQINDQIRFYDDFWKTYYRLLRTWVAKIRMKINRAAWKHNNRETDEGRQARNEFKESYGETLYEFDESVLKVCAELAKRGKHVKIPDEIRENNNPAEMTAFIELYRQYQYHPESHQTMIYDAQMRQKWASRYIIQGCMQNCNANLKGSQRWII